MAGIEKGGAAAHAAWSLIDPCAAERTHISSLPDDVATDVVRTLMIITRSIMRTIATSTEVSYRDLRAHVWQQLAAMPRDNDASESVRVLLTAWDEPELANLVTADMFSDADPADIAFEFAVLLNVLASGFTWLIGGPPQYYNKIRAWLGV
jgi:hypothetical protein